MKRHLSRADMNHLHQLGALKERGILTPEEFTAEKTMLLNREDPASTPTARRPSLTRPVWVASALALLIFAVAIVGISSRGSTARTLDSPSSSGR